MTYGLQVLNDSGELVMHNRGAIFGYIGRATHVGTTQAAYQGNDKFIGYTTYQIVWNAPILVALPLVAGYRTRLQGMSQSGSTWTITVSHTTGGTDAEGFRTQYATTVYVFGRTTGASGFGVALYDAAGNILGDLSRPPIRAGHRIQFTGTETQIARPTGYTAPAVIGWPFDERREATGSAPNIINRRYTYGWTVDSSYIYRQQELAAYIPLDSSLGNATNLYPTTALLLEASVLS